MTLVLRPKSFSAFRRPVLAAWLKLLSLRPPTSVTSPTCIGFGVGAADALGAALALGEPVVPAVLVPPHAAATVAASTRNAKTRFMSYPLFVSRALRKGRIVRRPDSSALARSLTWPPVRPAPSTARSR